jgi:hypothetical protein
MADYGHIPQCCGACDECFRVCGGDHSPDACNCARLELDPGLRSTAWHESYCPMADQNAPAAGGKDSGGRHD